MTSQVLRLLFSEALNPIHQMTTVNNKQHSSPEESSFLNIDLLPFKEDRQWIDKVEQIVNNNLSNNNFTVAQLANHMFISERQLRRRFKQLIDMTPARYLRKKRLTQAHAFLLQKEFKTVIQVAQAVGYKDVGTFKDNYRATYGEDARECLFR